MTQILQRFLVVLCCLFATMTQCVGEDGNSGKQSQTVRVGIFQLPGVLSLEQSGKIEGFLYEYLQRISVYTGWKYKFIGYGNTWNEILDMLEKGDIDLVYCASKNPENERKFIFSERACGYRACRISTPAGDKTYFEKNYSQWNGIRIGILAGGTILETFKQFAAENKFKYSLKSYKYYEEMHAALHTREIDAMVDSNLRKIEGEWVRGEFAPTPYFFIMRKNDNVRMRMLDEAMSQISITTPALLPSLRDKYLSAKHDVEIPFSKRERDFIDECAKSGRKFAGLLCPNRIPLAYEKDGKYCGIFNDIAEEIIRLSGLNIEIRYAPTISEYVKLKKSAKTEIIFDVLDNSQISDELGYLLTNPFTALSVSRIRTGNPDTKAKIAAVKNSPLLEELISNGIVSRSERIRYYDTPEEAFEAVRKGQVRECYIYTRMAEHFLNENVSFGLSFDLLHNITIPFSVGVRNNDKDSTLLAGILEKCVNRLNPNFISQTYRKHSPQPEEIPLFAFFLQRYLWQFVSVVALISVLLLVALIFAFRQRRKALITDGIIKLLPLRFALFDKNARALKCVCGNGTKVSVADEIKRNIGGFEKIIAEVADKNIPRTIEFSIDGRTCTATVAKYPNKICGQTAVLFVSHDTGDLQKTAKRLKFTLNCIGDAVITTDRRGIITMINPVAERITGYSATTAVGRPHTEILDIVGYDDNAKVKSPLLKALSSGKNIAASEHADLISKSGRRYHIAESASAILDENGRTSGAILVFRDVTSECLQRDELRDALAQLQEGAEMMNFATFNIHWDTMEISGSSRLGEMLKIKDGKVADINEWIYPDDIPTIIKSADKFARAKRGDIISLDYRMLKDGQIHYFRAKLTSKKSRPHDHLFSGIVQDTTDTNRKSEEIEKRRKLWDIVLDCMSVMFFAKNADDNFRYILANRALADSQGKSVDEIVGKTDSELDGSIADKAAILRNDAVAARTEMRIESDEEIVDMGGRVRRIHAVRQSFTDPEGRRLVLGMLSDRTQIYQFIQSEQITGEALKQIVLEDSFDKNLDAIARILLDTMHCDRVVIALYDNQGAPRYYKDWYSHLNMPINSTGIELRERFWATHIESLRAGNLLKVEDLRSTEIINEIFRRNCAFGEHSAIGAPFFEEGKLKGLIFLSFVEGNNYFSMLTEKTMYAVASLLSIAQKREQQAKGIRSALEQAQNAAKAKSFFIASISHEIRTPLNAVIGFADLLKDRSLSDSMRDEYLDSIDNSGNSLLRLINDVLDLSILESGNVKPIFESVNFKQMCDETIEIFRFETKNKQIELREQIGEIPTILIEKLRVRQILFNLIGNAVKYTSKGSVTVEANYEPQTQKGGVLRFWVKDTGVGISPEDQKKLMEPFVQLSRMRGTNLGNNSTGLGLAISQRLVQKMGGKLTFKSRPDEGSMFTVEIPVRLCHQSTEIKVAENIAEKKSDYKNLSLLLVDDVAMNLKVLEALCRKFDFGQITAVRSGSEALNKMRRHKYDIVLTDMWMPQMNGRELAENIRKEAQWSKIPILAVTADIEANDNFDMGAFTDLILKPVTLDKIREALQKAISANNDD